MTGGVGHSPVWSPDGKSLARLSDHGLVVRSLETGEDRVFRYNGSGFLRRPTWLHDGSGLLVIGGLPAAGQSKDIYRADLKDGEFRRVLNLLASPTQELSPFFALSPDDQTGYFFMGDDTTHEAALVAVEFGTGRRREVMKLTSRKDRFWTDLAISRDGRTLAMLGHNILLLPRRRMPSTVPSQLAVVNVDGTGHRDIYGPFSFSGLSRQEIGWTSEGQILFSTTSGGRQQLMRISPTGGQPEFTGIDFDRAFDLSADGSKIAFVRSPNADSELWALDVSSLIKGR